MNKGIAGIMFMMMLVVALTSGCTQISNFNITQILPPGTLAIIDDISDAIDVGIPPGETYTIVYTSIYDCDTECNARNYDEGDCQWPLEASSSSLNIGPCMIPGSRHCGNEDQCWCYCYNIILEEPSVTPLSSNECLAWATSEGHIRWGINTDTMEDCEDRSFTNCDLQWPVQWVSSWNFDRECCIWSCSGD